MFTLAVDDFGVKYFRWKKADHLINAIKNNYTVTKYWAGSLYCGISLKWDYVAKHIDTAGLDV